MVFPTGVRGQTGRPPMCLLMLLLVAAGCQGPLAQAQPVELPADCGAPVDYVALGDSTVVGVGASSPANSYVSRLSVRLRTAYPRGVTTNLGVSGATSADVVREQLPKVGSLHPSLVTLSVGPNDITQGKDVTQYRDNIRKLLDALLGDISAVTVVNLLPDLALAPRFTPDERSRLETRTQQVNDVLRGEQGRRGLELVDLYTASQRERPGHPELFSADGYHPSDAGYARWAELMWSGVARRVAPACLRGG